jgi:hypothetical protein
VNLLKGDSYRLKNRDLLSLGTEEEAAGRHEVGHSSAAGIG